MTDTRRYLLTRCLRLEAQIIALRAQLVAPRPRPRGLTPDDRALIRALYGRGMARRSIALQTGWSVGTVYNVTRQ